MSYRLPQLETPDDEPFKHDALDREATVKFLTSVIERSVENPLVLAIDAPYGTGKTTFVGMLRATLVKKNFQTIYFDAWRADYVGDPLVAMVAALDQVVPKEVGVGEKIKASLGVVRRVVGSVAKRGVVAAAKVATVGTLDLEKDIEKIYSDLAGEATVDLVGAFQKEQELISCFRDELEKVVKQLPDVGKRGPLVFFIDELDRCRPDFAISLLERVKHMFDVANIVFVLSVDKAQLEAATAAIYGERIDAAEYLRKFIDLEFALPASSSRRFLEAAVTRAGLDKFFDERAGYSENRKDREYFVNIMFALATIFGLSLRAQERCIARLKLVLEQTPTNQYLDPQHLALLLVLRVLALDMFNKVVNGTISPDELLEFMRSQPDGDRVLDSVDGRILVALVFAEDRDETRSKQRIRNLEGQRQDATLSAHERAKIDRLIALIGHFSSGRSQRPGNAFRAAARKIDIVSRINE
jgi:hypothetical protein